METLWVDLNNMGHDGMRLICKGTLDELKEKSIQLYDGLQILIWDNDQDENGNADNLVVEAIVKYSNTDQCWVAQFDNAHLKNQSQRS